jgi:hypothetical protein
MKIIKNNAFDYQSKKMIYNVGLSPDETFYDKPTKKLFVSPKDKSYKVLRFAGIKDLNKKEIYEGFVVKSTDGFEYIVRYGKHDGGIGFYLVYTKLNDDGTLFTKALFDNHEYEIIGDIYRNPEYYQEVRNYLKSKNNVVTDSIE